MLRIVHAVFLPQSWKRSSLALSKLRYHVAQYRTRTISLCLYFDKQHYATHALHNQFLDKRERTLYANMPLLPGMSEESENFYILRKYRFALNVSMRLPRRSVILVPYLWLRLCRAIQLETS